MAIYGIRRAILTPGKGGGVTFGALKLNGATITLNAAPITLSKVA